MSAFHEAQVLSVHHWTDKLFSFKTTRDPGLRFSNGHFTMIGLKTETKPLLRAYSIASANYEENLEFLSIKVPNGPLTSKLQYIQPGDTVMIGRKPTGTLLIDYLKPGKRLYLLSTGTGLAPFMSIVRDPATYEKFERVILVHGVPTAASRAAFGNLFAAMPSLHVGWSTWSALAILPVLRRRGLQALVLLYPLITAFAIVVTANHWILDAVGGWVALGLAWVIVVGVERLRYRARVSVD